MLKQKEGIKIIFKTILHMLIFNIISFIIFNLSFFNTEKTGISEGLFSKGIYEINILIFIICISISILSYTFFWQEYLKQDLKKLYQNDKKYIIIFIILFFIFIIIEFITIIFTMLLKVNWGYISNFPVEETYLIILIYQLIFPIIDLVRNKLNKA